MYEYIVPFFPRPSYSFLCAPKNKGGVNLINTHSQYKALHMVYINKMLSRTPSNFLFDIIRHYIFTYTKQPSFIPLLLSPKTIRNKFNKLPHMKHLINLIIILPYLKSHPNGYPTQLITSLSIRL